jgi:outer membrane protein TolC
VHVLATVPRLRAALYVILSVIIAPAVTGADPGPLRFSIQDAMTAAVRASLPLTAARATRERTRADVTVARSGYFPQVSLTGSYVNTLRSEYEGLFTTSPDMPDTPDTSVSGMLGDLSQLPFAAAHAWRAGLDVTLSIWDGGRTASAVALAHGSERSAELDELGRRALAVLDVTDAYFGAELAGQVAVIAEASLGLAEQTLGQVRAGMSQGTAPEFDVVRAEVTRDNQRTALVRARAARDLALVRLHRLLGVPFDQPLELTTKLGGGDVAELARMVAGVPRGTERVSVAQARANVEIRRAQVGIARAARWPHVALFTSYGVVDYPDGFWPDQDWRTSWTVGASVSLPLFTGFRTIGAIAGARAEVRAAEALAAEAAQLAAVDERERASDVAVEAAAYAASHHSTELARRAHEIAQVRYRQGVSTYLELVDARIALDQAQINRATAARDLQVARVRVALLPALPVAGVSVAPSIPPALAVTPSTAAPAASTTTPQPGVPGAGVPMAAPGASPATRGPR